ncbi:hypothetical protein PM082_016107 [Marasmius tenuissimus]|nr:hypothetical protein PM082_016107 [Marasmius tenuissimus]
MTVAVLSLDGEKSALLAHVVEQIEKNVDFLVSENYLQESQASAFLSTLANINSQQFEKVTTRRVASLQPIRRPSGGVPTPFAPILPPPQDSEETIESSSPSPRLPPRPTPPTETSDLPTCRAIWCYNESGVNPDELSFNAGDIIEIVEETTGDWWTGRVNGQEGLFPSSYVDRIDVGVAAGRPPPPKRVVPTKPRHTPSRATTMRGPLRR